MEGKKGDNQRINSVDELIDVLISNDEFMKKLVKRLTDTRDNSNSFLYDLECCGFQRDTGDWL
jgi:hypothetical protein